MRSTIFELTALLGVGLFLIGTICLVTVVIHSVFPAFEEQNLREINCTIASSNLDRKVKCAHSKRNLTCYPCLRIFVLCGKGLDHVDVKTNDSLERRHPVLLLKDIHSLDEQCTYEPEECKDKSDLSQHIQSQRDNPIGLMMKCYYNPKDPSQIVRSKVSNDNYDNLVFGHVLWPLTIILMGVVVLAIAGCYFSLRFRNKYERLEGISISTLQRTL